jgi:hypothetical protein
MEDETNRNYYAELAEYLNPADVHDGQRQVDIAILAGLRKRSAPRNMGRAIRLSGYAVLYYAMIFTLEPVILHMGGMEWPYMRLSWWSGGALFIAAMCTLYVGMSSVMSAEVVTDPPYAIYEWLRDETNGRVLRYWHEIYWSHAKREANVRRVLGFTLWRKEPAELSLVSPHSVPRRGDNAGNALFLQEGTKSTHLNIL